MTRMQPNRAGLRACRIAMVALVSAATGLAVAQPVAPPAPPAPAADSVVKDTGQTLSATGQFRILGAGVSVRRQYAGAAEQVKRELLQLLHLEDRWRHPVVVQLHDAAVVSRHGPSVVARLQSVGASVFRFQIDVRLDENARPAAFDEAVLRCLLGAEVVGNRRADEVRDGDLVPPWLMAGVAEAIAFRREPERSAMAAVVFSRGRAFPVEKLLAETPDGMPAATQAAYRASACGLVLTLLAQENGADGFHRLLADLAQYSGKPGDLIRYHFQALAATESGLEKWWALQVADMARPKALDFLGAEESHRRLAQALVADVLPESGLGQHQPTELAQIIARPPGAERQKALGTIWGRLRALEPRIHPLYRELASSYGGLVAQVMEGKAKHAATDLAALDAVRSRYVTLLDQVDDYLNWWEATQGRGDPRLFEAYRHLSQPAVPAARPDDPIGQYLDEIARAVE